MAQKVYHNIVVLYVACLMVYCADYGQDNLFTMLSHDQQYIVDVGGHLTLRCEFYKAHFNLLDNPIVWKKWQFGDVSEVNILGSVKEPFDVTGRFKVTYSPSPPRYVLSLTIRDIDHTDSANYTCEVTAPNSVVLGRITYAVHVKAQLESLVITHSNVSNINKSPVVKTITFIENEPTHVECVAHGGSPPPDMTIKIGSTDYTKYFQHGLVTSMTGNQGFKHLRTTSILSTTDFRASERDDGKSLHCTAQVPGLPRVEKSTLIIVNYAPRIDCRSSSAYVDDHNVHVACDVTAWPPVTSWYWVIDDNGTTLSEGQVIGSYWSIETDVHNGKHLQLYFRRTTDQTFRQYKLVARNSVAVSTAHVELKRRYRDASHKSQSSANQKTSYRNVEQSSEYRDHDPSSLVSTSGTNHHRVALSTIFIVIYLSIIL